MAIALLAGCARSDRAHVDLCVHGSTPAGAVVAISAARRGRDVALVYPGFAPPRLPEGGLDAAVRSALALLAPLVPEVLEPGGPTAPPASRDAAGRGLLDRLLAREPRVLVVPGHRIEDAVTGDDGRLARVVFAPRPAPGDGSLAGARRLRVQATRWVEAAREGQLIEAAGSSVTVVSAAAPGLARWAVETGEGEHRTGFPPGAVLDLRAALEPEAGAPGARNRPAGGR